MEKFKNKYRIPSARLQNWDYGWNGAYFITICTHNREYFFGEIINEKMELSQIGVLANVFWYEIKNHTQNVELGEFVVMPNHIHGILILNNDNDDDNGNDTDTDTVETLHATSLPTISPTISPIQSQKNKNKFMSSISPKSNTVSTIIRSYKSVITKHCNRLGFNFKWQTRFYDHIIRNDKSFQKISEYIINNPINWKDDKFYKQAEK